MMTETPAPVLTAQDRCDRCGAQAHVLYDNGLLFCAHHNREHAPALVAKGATVLTDTTSTIA
jgi:hypothetical protein